MTGLKPHTQEELWHKLQDALTRISRLEHEVSQLKREK